MIRRDDDLISRRKNYNFISPILISSITACALPFTPNFWMTFDMWFRTVFSDMKSSSAISFVVLSWTKISNTSFSRFVNMLL